MTLTLCNHVNNTWCNVLDELENMLFVMLVKVAYTGNKPPVVGEHAFSMTGFFAGLLT